MADVTGHWIKKSFAGFPSERMTVDTPTRNGGWNCTYYVPIQKDDFISKRDIVNSSNELVILQTIPASDLQAWIDQGVISRPN